jgi:hypothetical protein
MTTFEYVCIAIAVTIIAVRIAMFFPRQGKHNDAVNA